MFFFLQQNCAWRIKTDEQAILAFLSHYSLRVSPFSSNLKSTMLQMITISLVFGLITLTNAEYQPASAFLKKKVIFFDALFIFLFMLSKHLVPHCVLLIRD